MSATHRAVEMMEAEGTHFEGKLAELWFVCDSKNRAILETAFVPTFGKWEDRLCRQLEIEVEAYYNQ